MTINVENDSSYQQPKQYALDSQELPLDRDHYELYTDACGGPSNRWPVLRRVGWGAALIDSDRIEESGPLISKFPWWERQTDSK